MTTEMSTNNTSVQVDVRDAWKEWINIFKTETHNEVDFVNYIPVICQTDLTRDMINAIREISPESDGNGSGKNNRMSCNTCRSNLMNIIRMKNFNGEPFFMPGPKTSYPSEYHRLWDASRTGIISNVVIALPSFFGLCEKGGFNHFSINTSTWSWVISDHIYRDKLLVKYIPLMMNVFEQNGVKGIDESMDILINTLPNITYGSKLLESAVWFKKHIVNDFNNLNYTEKLRIITNAIFDIKYSIDIGSNDVVINLYHQLTNNTLDALKVCDSIEKLTSLLKGRLSPTNYQVKTALASDGQINNAIKHIGEFTVELMSVKSAIKHGAIEIEHFNNNSSVHAFGSMKRNTSSNSQRSPAGFAGRILNISTMTELMLNPPPNLEVYTPNQIPVYACDHTMKEGVYQSKFTWGFSNKLTPSIYNIFGWTKVVAILQMKNNYMFICKGAVSNPVHMSPCCHVSLLTVAYNKSCGSAFGNLSSHMKLQIGDDGPFAIGVGVSLDPIHLNDKNPRINGSIKLRSNGNEFTIR